MLRIRGRIEGRGRRWGRRRVDKWMDAGFRYLGHEI